MSAEIINFGGTTKGHIPPEKVIEAASAANLVSVLILGQREDGEFYAASSEGRDPWLISICEVFKHKLLSGQFE